MCFSDAMLLVKASNALWFLCVVIASLRTAQIFRPGAYFHNKAKEYNHHIVDKCCKSIY